MIALESLLALVSGGMAGALATDLARRLALRVNFVNQPNPIIPQHTAPVPYLGGVGVVAGLTMAIAMLWVTSDDELRANIQHFVEPAWSLGLSGYLVLGTVDDARTLRPMEKFGFQSALAVSVVWLGLSAPWSGIAVLDAALSVLLILTVINAVNLTDVCDGLVAGIAAVAFTFYGLMSGASVVAFASAGACLGFLVFNKPPARIYLGDGGSHALGFLLAALAIASIQESSERLGIVSAVLPMGVFLFELVFLTAVRVAKGLPWWRGSPDHFSLRFQAAGLSKLQTDLLSCGATAFLCTMAVLISKVSFALQFLLSMVVLVAAGLTWRILLRWEVVVK